MEISYRVKKSIRIFLEVFCAFCLLFVSSVKTHAQGLSLERITVPQTAHVSTLRSRGAIIPQDFNTRDIAFFCRQEIKLQHAHVPLIFRVGRLEDCNYMEQKPNSSMER